MKQDHDPNQRSRRELGRKGKLLLLAGSFLFALLLGEIALRVAGVSYPRLHQRDHWRGTACIPGRSFWQDKEGQAHVRFNNAGFRDRDWSKTKPPGTVRIAVFGDSYTQASQVALNERFTEQLAEDLRELGTFGDANLEVLNFGVSGYGTAQEYLTLEHVGWDYDPDVVILALLTGNDLRNNTRALEKDPGRPYYVLQDGELTLDTSFRESADHKKSWKHHAFYWLSDHSHLVQLAHRAYLMSRKRQLVSKQREQASPEPAGETRMASEGPVASGENNRAAHSHGTADRIKGELGLSDAIYQEPAGPPWTDAWDVTEAITAEMDKSVRQRGKRFLLVTLSNGIQVDPDPVKRKTYAEQLGAEDLYYADRRLQKFAARNGILALILAPKFAEYATSHNQYLHGFENTTLGRGHWNANGHRAAAQLIADKIDEFEAAGWRSAGSVTSRATPSRRAE